MNWLSLSGTAVLGLVLSVWCGPASAASSSDWDRCKDVNNADAVARSLAACTRILNDRGQAKFHAMALRNRCGIRITDGDYDEALVDCNRAARMEPDSAIVFIRRGMIYDKKKDFDRAIADYNEAIRIDPNRADAHFNRALVWESKGDTDRAIEDYSRAVRLNPDDDEARAALRRLRR